MRGRVLAIAVAVVALAVPVVALAGISGPTELISIGPTGQNPVTERGAASTSGDGRYVAFSTDGRDIDAADGNVFDDVFIRDRQTGTFERVSISNSGGDANGASTATTASLSSDAQKVAFASKATNLVGSDNNLRQDIFVRDRGSATTTLISRNFSGLDANGVASEPAISADGTKVAFTSTATDMTPVPDLDGRADVYVHDIASGVNTRISETPANLPGNGASGAPAISADGTKIAFQSTASDLVAGDTNGKSDVFVHDLSSGTTKRVSVSTAGIQATGDSIEPFISGDGRFVGYSTNSSLGGVKYTGSNDYELFLRDTAAGKTDRLSMRILPYEGDNLHLELTQGTNRRGRITPDGRLVAFDSSSSQFVGADGANNDVFVIDRATDQVTILSRNHAGTTSNGNSLQSAISSGGVSFRSNATNLASPGGAFNYQIFFRPFSADSHAADLDGDGVANLDDVCPLVADPAQTDTDGEGRGNACDGEDDSDTIVDVFEPAQDSDPVLYDTDGDGVNDINDDYPADSTKQIGTEHERLNIADHLGGDDGDAVAKFFWSDSSKRFEVRLTGVLKANTAYDVAVYRRHRGIRNQIGCQGTTNAAGAISCVRGGVRLTYFTHVELRRGGTVVATAVCDDPDQLIGERRCDVLE